MPSESFRYAIADPSTNLGALMYSGPDFDDEEHRTKLSLTIDAATVQRVRSISKRQGISVGGIIDAALREFFDAGDNLMPRDMMDRLGIIRRRGRH